MTQIIFFLIGCLVSGVAIYFITRRPYRREIEDLAGENLFLSSLVKKEFPSWEIFNSIHCPLVKKYHRELSDMIYQKFFTRKINFLALENFLNEMAENIYCGGKENILKGVIKETIVNIANSDIERLINEIIDFIEEGENGVDKTFIIISHSIEEMDDLLASSFIELFDQKIDGLLATDPEKRIHILEMQWLIKS